MKLDSKFGFIFLISFLPACIERNEFIQLKGEAQGTTYSIKYRNVDNDLIPEQIDSVFQYMDDNFSTYKKGSAILNLNSSQFGIAISPSFRELWELCWEVSIGTDGMFDPTLSPVLDLYNFKEKAPAVLDSVRIHQALSLTGMQLLWLKGDSLLKRNANVQLNLNAIAQGYTVDQISDLLEKHGIRDYMVEVGGELRVKGKNSKGTSWTIGIDKPLIDSRRQLLYKVNLLNRAMATSGNYRKFMIVNGRQVGHIINPKTGFPSHTNLLSATVFSQNCAKADGYATAFMCMNKEEVAEIVSRDPDLDVILISLENKDTVSYVSPGIARAISK